MGQLVLPYCIRGNKGPWVFHSNENQGDDDEEGDDGDDCTGLNKIIIFYWITQGSGGGKSTAWVNRGSRLRSWPRESFSALSSSERQGTWAGLEQVLPPDSLRFHKGALDYAIQFIIFRSTSLVLVQSCHPLGDAGSVHPPPWAYFFPEVVWEGMWTRTVLPWNGGSGMSPSPGVTRNLQAQV